MQCFFSIYMFLFIDEGTKDETAFCPDNQPLFRYLCGVFFFKYLFIFQESIKNFYSVDLCHSNNQSIVIKFRMHRFLGI